MLLVQRWGVLMDATQLREAPIGRRGAVGGPHVPLAGQREEHAMETGVSKRRQLPKGGAVMKHWKGLGDVLK